MAAVRAKCQWNKALGEMHALKFYRKPSRSGSKPGHKKAQRLLVPWRVWETPGAEEGSLMGRAHQE